MDSKDIVCEPCKEDGEFKPAEGFCVECQHYLCDECFHYHRLPKPMRHHRLLTKDEMPEKKVSGSLSEICPKHNGEMIKYYCGTHRNIGCNSCMITEHKKCEEVHVLDEIAKDVINSSFFEELRTRLTDINDDLEREISKAHDNIDSTKYSLEGVIKDVNNLQKDIDIRFDNLREQMIKEAQDKTNDDTESMLKLEESAKSAFDELSKLENDVEMLEETKQNKQLVIAVMRCKEKQQDLEARLEEVKKKNYEKRFAFIPNEFLMNMLENVDSLGELFEFDTIGTLRDQRSLYGNYVEYGILKLIPLSDNCFILDSIYNSVKLYDIEKRTCVCETTLSSCPWDGTLVDEDTIAVTLPNEKTIQFISGYDGSLRTSTRITIDARCEGIAYDGNNFLVACSKPAKVLILDLKGVVVRNISTDESGDCLFQQPAYITYHRKKQLISVTDRKTDSVTIMTMDGKVKNILRHEHMKLPLAVEFIEDSDNEVCVSDFQKHTFEFCLSTGDCKEVIKSELINDVLKECEEKLFMCVAAVWKADECIF